MFSSFTPEQQEVARRTFLRLTQPGEGTEDTRRRARLDELASSPADSEEVDGVVRALVDAGLERGSTARAAIGYRQALDELHGRATREEAIAETQRLTRRYARRQVSWFQRYPALDVDGPVGADAIAASLLA